MRRDAILTRTLNSHFVETESRVGRPAEEIALHQVVAVVPAHNEERYIGSVVLQLRRCQVQVIVVDDGSQDGTASVAELAGASVLRLTSNQGKAAALNAGFEEARRCDPDVIVMLDADAQHCPEELPLITAPVLADQADLVIGSRYLENTSNTPLGRRLGHSLLNLVTGLASGRYATDSQSGYRAFSRRAYRCCDFHSQGFTVEAEMQFLASEHGLRLVEVPITIRYHQRPKRNALEQGLQVLSGIVRLTGQYRPLLFFGLPGLALIAAGIGWGVLVVQRLMLIGELAVGYTLLCVLLCVLGLVLLSTGVMLHTMRSLLIEFLRPQARGEKVE